MRLAIAVATSHWLPDRLACRTVRTFEQIGLETKTDKVTHHAYQRFYPRFLERLRSETFAMLEIGFHEGASQRLWEEYFPKATIYGVDIANKDKKLPRGEVFQLDQSRIDHLNELFTKLPKCKLIIDDGSHVPTHQLSTFLLLFTQVLAPGGVYIVEDIECSYWRPEAKIYGYRTGSLNLVDWFKDLVDGINAEFTGVANGMCISSVSYFRNCIVITKQDLDEMAENVRPYRFAKNLPNPT